MSIIDEELAKAFLDDPGNVDLSKATTITDEAAEALSGEGDLYLNGLTSLSDSGAKLLLRHVEGGLSLDLDELPDSAAEILRQHPSFQEDDDDEAWDDDDE